ncbi:hypothetical protein ACWELB_25440 [Streptomyces asiaticus]|uniref:hypothetical protein n=1 Tax=Streptomyces asiaticus TaxID=114695 RepID=UPI003D7206DA
MDRHRPGERQQRRDPGHHAGTGPQQAHPQSGQRTGEDMYVIGEYRSLDDFDGAGR